MPATDKASKENRDISRRHSGKKNLLILGGILLLIGGGVIAAFGGLNRIRHAARTAYRQYKQRQHDQAILALLPKERAESPEVLYKAGLRPGWKDWSWAKHSLDASPALYGKTCIRFLPQDYRGIYLHSDRLSVRGYSTLEFAFKGEPRNIGVSIASADNHLQKPIPLDQFAVEKMKQSGWMQYRIPLDKLGVDVSASVRPEPFGITIVSLAKAPGPEVFIDCLQIMPNMSLPLAPRVATIPVSVDASADVHPISPLIYGAAHKSPEEVRALGITLNRWGGNGNSRYNWVENGANAARDWYFENRGKAGRAPGAEVDSFVDANHSVGATTYFTIPTLGWVAHEPTKKARSLNVPSKGGTAIDPNGSIAGYDPSTNRARTSIRSLARKGAPFVLEPSKPGPADAVYQDEFVNHMRVVHGTAQQGGIRFYALDNEPDLWSSTHTDVHPAQMGYTDVANMFAEYATAVKTVDAVAQIGGPVSWGWTGYFYSALDQGTDNYYTHADRKQHGDTPFLLWFLEQMHLEEKKRGKRLLDVLDVHYYPQGQAIYSDASDPDTQACRLRATRSLYDPSYTDESWIGEPVRLIPRLKEWVAQGYPGTKVGIMEWSFGAPRDISGGLATADALGIFGREGLDMAAIWSSTKPTTPNGLAFRLFRNPQEDGVPGFGDLSCRAQSISPDRLTAYAATEKKSGVISIVLINKMPKATVTVPLRVTGWSGNSKQGKAWQFSQGQMNELVSFTIPALRNGKTVVVLPPYSATLIRILPTTKKETN